MDNIKLEIQFIAASMSPSVILLPLTELKNVTSLKVENPIIKYYFEKYRVTWYLVKGSAFPDSYEKNGFSYNKRLNKTPKRIAKLKYLKWLMKMAHENGIAEISMFPDLLHSKRNVDFMKTLRIAMLRLLFLFTQ